MASDKEIKKEFKKKASKSPENYYAVSALKKEGFTRKQCKKCNTFFWTVNPEQELCGDPSCSGGFRFIGNTPAKEKLSYIDVWKRFSSMFKKLGYTPIKRYPVVARWRDDTDFVQASIYDFQPYVVSGEVEAPANPLVVPQFSLRFNDIDNIGITGAHYCAFVMIGQHAFMPEEKWDQEKYFSDIHFWLKKGLGLANEEITFHEDAWAGGGNFGPCMEYFSRGLELGNQVYMLFEQTASGPKKLPLKVLDMGMGQERNAWFSHGTSTSYETTFPSVCEKLYKITGIKADKRLMAKFLPYSSYLNVDEVDNIDKAWQDVAAKVGVDVKELKEKVLPLAGLFSVAEHSRALLVALSDGALPSNVGGGYNLRIILRRALSFIDQNSWNISLPDVAEWHAEYLKPIFPELKENLDNVSKILEVERKKYAASKKKSRALLKKIVKETNIGSKRLLQLYDSHGISPELIKEEAKAIGKDIEVPKDFYSLVSELHEKKAQEHRTKRDEKLSLEGLEDTKALYYDDYLLLSFRAKPVKLIDNILILDRTAFYPTSGGQLHDKGRICLIGENNKEIACFEVIDVFKQGAIIAHALNGSPSDIASAVKRAKEAIGYIDKSRRIQLAQHHTATHIINYAARQILGSHINQAGAKKTEKKAHLDITHYESLDEKQLKEIEGLANSIIKQSLEVKSFFLPRSEAEKKYGMSIYQGGAVPGKMIRVIEIGDIDAEACGGTHLKNTKEAELIKILKSAKVQDGIVRITFSAGKAAESKLKEAEEIAVKSSEVLGVSPYALNIGASELFKKWKKAKKALKKKEFLNAEFFNIKANEDSEKSRNLAEIVEKTAKTLKTQPEHILKAIARFKKELDKIKALMQKQQG